MLRRYKHSGDQDAAKKRAAWVITAIAAGTVLVVVIVAFSLTPPQGQGTQTPLVPEKEVEKGIVSSDSKAIHFGSFSAGINLFTYSSRFLSSNGKDKFYISASQVAGKVVAVTENDVQGLIFITCPNTGQVGESISISGIWTQGVDSMIMVRSASNQQMGFFGQYNHNFVYTTPSLVTLATPSEGEAYTITFTLIDSTNTELKITHGTTTKSVTIPYYMPNLPPTFTPSIKFVSITRFATPGIGFAFTSISTSWDSDIGSIVYL